MSNVVVDSQYENIYNVSVVRQVTIGSKFHIAPTMCYMGVETGVVQVLDIVTAEEYNKAPHRFPDITEFINVSYEDINESKDYLDNTVWIKYNYPNDHPQYEYYFPIDTFAEHISSYQ